MEFEELQKIWDTQNNQPMYIINEKALHNRIVTKRYQAIHIAGFTEWLLLIVNIAAGSFLVGTNFMRHNHIFIYGLAAWMFGSALYVLVKRIRRMKELQRYDRTLSGDLQHALAAASYQVRIAHIMRWNAVPVAILVLLSIWEGGKSVWLALGVSLFFILSFYASGWELSIYKNKKRELEVLWQKLQENESQPSA
ncbi:hypothetical protein FAM09_10480 [Niastella caeni]|uniref:Uncharacterized protein n=1 Tax=Niastella caeni TaxID=2569763 RepID=A0A4S8I1B1_9BACT|nr:hypothetical protein [Niastella caeni]THU40284.1 hypothetical protein FAM09_10480 [Niastella caeni]